MTRTKTSTLALILLATGAAAYLAGSWRAARDTVSAAAPPAAGTVLYYHCPMHPDVKSSVPGTAPCCGMAFEAVYAQDGAAGKSASRPAGGEVVVSAVQQQLMGVTTGRVTAFSGTEVVTVFGRVIPDESRVYRLTAGLEGYITEVSGATTGTRVARGQWLASYATAEARVPVSAFITALNVLDREQKNGNPDTVSLAAATTSVTLATERLLTLGMSPLQIDEIRRTRAATTVVKVTSPVDGLVLARNLSSGQRFDAGTELFAIADLRRVWILSDVPADTAALVAPATPATVRVRGADVGVRAHASAKVLPQFDSTTQSFKIRLEADNARLALRPGMFVDVDMQVSYRDTLIVPADAVVIAGLRRYVFVERRPGVFEPRAVETGRRHGGRITVRSGLAAGDRIALSGTFLLDSESRMRADDRPHH